MVAGWVWEFSLARLIWLKVHPSSTPFSSMTHLMGVQLLLHCALSITRISQSLTLFPSPVIQCYDNQPTLRSPSRLHLTLMTCYDKNPRTPTAFVHGPISSKTSNSNTRTADSENLSYIVSVLGIWHFYHRNSLFSPSVVSKSR